MGSELEVEITGASAANRCWPQEEDASRREEDPAFENGANGSGTRDEELHLEGCKQGSGVSAPPTLERLQSTLEPGRRRRLPRA